MVAVSVILPTFNRSQTLSRAIASVLSQSFRDLELIVVDDGSAEPAQRLVSDHRDARIRFIRRGSNGGAAAARNTGLAVARGDYIAFQDSDDIWLPEKLSRQVGLLESLSLSTGIVTGGKILYVSSLMAGRQGLVHYAPRGEPLRIEDDQVARLLTQNRLSVQCALFRRVLFPEAVWFDTCARANEDWEFAVRAAKRTKIYEDSLPVVLAFVSDDSISRNDRKQCIGQLRVIKKNKAELRRLRSVHADMLFDVARTLYRTRKRRRARNLLAEALRRDPLVAGRWLQRKLIARLR